MASDAQILEGIGEYQYGFKDPETYVFKSRKGLDKEIVEQISAMKGEPEWMLDFRLKALAHYEKRPMPTWGGDLSKLDLDDIYYYVKPTDKEGRSWDDVPETIKNTFDRLGIPEAEQKFLAGVGAQYESETVYHKVQENLVQKMDIDRSPNVLVDDYIIQAAKQIRDSPETHEGVPGTGIFIATNDKGLKKKSVKAGFRVIVLRQKSQLMVE